MKTDTAHEFWGEEWARADGTTKWEQPEPEVMIFAQTLPADARV
ncbi:MAG: class I SAM-dependent methyltransferase, partial [Hoeflea sp.]|nr:class I SAM-dependent methyltransferase [Hoeflea sp.]